MLQGMQCFQLSFRRCLRHGSQRERGGAGVKNAVDGAQDLVAVGLREGLAGELLDALVVGPGIGGKLRVHGPSARACKQAGGGQHRIDTLLRLQELERGRGGVAPAAQGVEQIGHSDVGHGSGSFLRV
ncbi:MAG: hypothetical protein ABS37_12170 [Acidovorax sp. SCN 65-108]|nr:MAG: hypothetical protein ABS37_12170 [Acidovorax sp. SCN 65-108]